MIITGSTFGPRPFDEICQATSAAGFEGLSLWVRTCVEYRERGTSWNELRACMADRGLRVQDVDPLHLWLGSGAPSYPMHPIDVVLEVAQELEAPCVNIVVGGHYEENAARDALTEAVERITGVGLRACLEFAPFLAVPDLALAWNLAQPLAELGLMLDTWHFVRSHSQLREIDEIPPERIIGLQVSDPAGEAETDLLSECMNRRIVPGRHSQRIVSHLRGHGVGISVIAEVFSEQLRALPALSVARICAEATKTLPGEAAARD